MQPKSHHIMQKTDPVFIHTDDIPAALSLLSRLPVHSDAARGAAAAWAYPLVGLVLATLAGAFGMIALWLGLPETLAALVMLAAMILLSGAMHEDGLADCADGLWGGWHAAARLDIMKDSHIGTYGVIALILSLGARWAALSALLGVSGEAALAAFVVAAMLSRAAMPGLMWALPHARATGLSHHVGAVGERTVCTGVILAAGAALLLVGWGALLAVIIAGVATLVVGGIAHAKIGGQTGDVLGAAQQIVEIAVLCALLSQI